MNNIPIMETIHACPACGKTDWFSVNVKYKPNVFKCKHCGQHQTNEEMNANSSKRLVRDADGKYAIQFTPELLTAVINIFDISEHDTEIGDSFEPEFRSENIHRIRKLFDAALYLFYETHPQIQEMQQHTIDVMLNEQDAQDACSLLTKLVETVLYQDEDDCENNAERAYVYAANAAYDNVLKSYETTVAHLLVD